MRVSRGSIAGTTLLVSTLLLSLGGAGAHAQEAESEVYSVELMNGIRLEGAVRQIQSSLYLVQTRDFLCELSFEEIAKVNGSPGVSALVPSGERLLRNETYEVVAPNGDVEQWHRIKTTNNSSRVWTYLEWGAAEWELPRIETMKVFDKYGQRLEHRLCPVEGENRYRVVVDFLVPLTPGETVGLTECIQMPGAARQKGDEFTYTFYGDFAEDRILHRKVRLPEGASVIDVDPPTTSQFEYEGSPVLVWRRYYPRGERYPLKVVYRLSE